MNTIKKLLAFSLIIASMAIGMEEKRSDVTALMNKPNDHYDWDDQFVFPSFGESRKRKNEDNGSEDEALQLASIVSESGLVANSYPVPCKYEASLHCKMVFFIDDFNELTESQWSNARYNMVRKMEQHIVQKHIFPDLQTTMLTQRKCFKCGQDIYKGEKNSNVYVLIYQHYLKHDDNSIAPTSHKDILAYVKASLNK